MNTQAATILIQNIHRIGRRPGCDRDYTSLYGLFARLAAVQS